MVWFWIWSRFRCLSHLLYLCMVLQEHRRITIELGGNKRRSEFRWQYRVVETLNFRGRLNLNLRSFHLFLLGVTHQDDMLVAAALAVDAWLQPLFVVFGCSFEQGRTSSPFDGLSTRTYIDRRRGPLSRELVLPAWLWHKAILWVVQGDHFVQDISSLSVVRKVIPAAAFRHKVSQVHLGQQTR